MNGKDEKFYNQGFRQATTTILQQCCHNLGYKDPEAGKSSWILERERVVSALRSTCEHFGDNEWMYNLSLDDVINKHLANYLEETSEIVKEAKVIVNFSSATTDELVEIMHLSGQLVCYGVDVVVLLKEKLNNIKSEEK